MVEKLSARHVVRKVFLEDWGIKLLALVITLALWLGITGLSTDSQRSMTVPLNTIISNDAIITNTPRQEIEIVVRGDKRRLDQVNRGDISASLDLTAVVPGDWVIQLSPDTISVNNLPQGLVLQEVRPGNMAVKLDAVAEKELPVRASLTGTVAEGYEVYSSTATPARIRVRGPASMMALMDHVRTDEIDLDRRRESFTVRQTSVVSPEPKAVVLNTVADVFVRVGERRAERSFTVPIFGEQGTTASFTIFGPRSVVAQAKADEFRVEMYLDDAGELKPRVILPRDLQDVAEIRGLRLR